MKQKENGNSRQVESVSDDDMNVMKRYNSKKDKKDTKETEKDIIAAMQYALMKLKEEEGRLQRKLAECIHKEEEEEEEALQ